MMLSSSAFHPGELIAQRRAGTRGVANELSAALRFTLPEGGALKPLLDKLRMVCMTSVSVADAERPSAHFVWVSVLFGNHFVDSPSPDRITVHLNGLSTQDILYENMTRSSSDSPVGLLAIDFRSRRRYRTNGVVNGWPSLSQGFGQQAVLDISVQEAFSNCPKYIQARDVTPSSTALPATPSNIAYESDICMSDADIALIIEADTLFFGTYYPEKGADVSHRGGRPGFVRVVSNTEIFWPDYRGNGMFQSFGNLQLNDRAGVMFIDFSSGCTVQLSGSAGVDWEIDPASGVEPAAMRLVRFHVDGVRRSVGPVTNYRWEKPEYSPYNPILPHEDETTERRLGEYPMTVSLVKIKRETPNVKTFRFLAPERIPFLPGQYASFEFDSISQISTESEPLVRTWTLSEVANSTEGDLTLEVSVKRKAGGVVSNWLHDHAMLGMHVKLLGTGGEMTPFNGDPIPQKLLFISGGIGITPNMAILRGIGARSDPQTTTPPDIVFIHQERYEDHIPFKEELFRRTREANGRTKLFALISGEKTAMIAKNLHDCGRHLTGNGDVRVSPGRVEEGFLQKNVPDIQRRRVYLCGPIAFMESVKVMLATMGVPSETIVTEDFDF